MKQGAGLRTLIGMILAGLVLCFAPPASAKDYLDMAGAPVEVTFEKNSIEVQEMIDALQARIAEEPENYENYFMLAFIYNYTGKHEGALAALKKELEYYTGEDLHTVYYNIALTYMNLGNIAEGKKYLDTAMEWQPDDILNNALLLDYSILTKNYTQAAIQMKFLSQRVPGRDWYHESFSKFNDREDANEYDFLALYTEALAKNPDNHYAIRTHALMLRNKPDEEFLKNYDYVMSELKRAYHLKPDYVFHSIGIGNTYLWKWAMDKDKKDLQQALKWMLKARKLEPENHKVLWGLGYVYLYMEQFDKAIENFEKGIALGGDEGTFQKMLAQAYNAKAYSCYKKRRNLDVGMKFIEKALIFEPHDGMITSTKAELLYALGRYEEAYEYITKAIALEPGYAEMEQDLENIKKAMAENSSR